jgi:hypothetical protein
MTFPSYPPRQHKRWRPPFQLYRHKERGVVYRVLSSDAMLQCPTALTAPRIEKWAADKTFTVYQSLVTQKVYIRLTSEFMDGRFEVIDPGEVKNGGG